METSAEVIEFAKDRMKKALEHLADNLRKIRAGKATPSMLDSVMVEYYGANTPINQVAGISTPDARTIIVQPWEKHLIQDIERAIVNSNLGFAPQNDGERIIISIPALTEERRLELVKQAKAEVEHTKIGIRNARKDANEEVKKLLKDNISEDEAKNTEMDIQALTDQHIEKTEEILKLKEADILKV